MTSLLLRSGRFGVLIALALLLGSKLASFTGHQSLGHLLFWQGTNMHVWFPCGGWTNRLCVRSPMDWQYFSFGLAFGSLVYALGVAVILGSHAASKRRSAAFPALR